ncbi:hypothetical protein M569_09470 [Genlisea aurea]|uniref:MD-2-related lipid-recognition domain-containing protein n=1 Tax=Genlisea aurea TaxID=192259 RepID=S8CEM6_9LAMI|nr:hypothetical protein M569_09470 [Genlisea aurea]
MDFSKIVLVSLVALFASSSRANLTPPECFFDGLTITGSVDCPNNSSQAISGASVNLLANAPPFIVFYNQTTTNATGSFNLTVTLNSFPPFISDLAFPDAFYLNVSLPTGSCGYSNGSFLIYNGISQLEINACLYGANNPALG